MTRNPAGGIPLGAMVRVNRGRADRPLKSAVPIALVVLTVFAGCVEPRSPATSDPTEPLEVPLRFSYTCPPGATDRLSDGLCVTTFTDPRETFEEPYVAVHPARPEIMVVGMNAWHADPRPVMRIDGRLSSEMGRVTIFVTEDGGASWQRERSPPILYGTDRVGKTSYSGDPVLEFDDDGVLHYFQTSVAFDDVGGPAFPYLDIQYARSEDLGASWSKNVLLADDGDNDRPWLTIGPQGDLFATWRNNMVENAPPSLAWSKDGGTTWSIFTAPSECTHGDRAIVHGDDVLMPCTLDEGSTVNKIQMNRFDRETERFESLGLLPMPKGWDPEWALAQWDRSPDGSVLAVAVRQTDPGGFVVFSHDGGTSWSDPLTLIDLCACQPETGSLHTYGARFDAWGSLHLMLTDAVVEPDQADETKKRYVTGERGVFHVIVDTEGDTLHVRRLPTSIEQDPRTPPGLGPPFGRDDYYIPAFWTDGGAVAWTRDKGVDLAHVVVDV